MKVAARLGVFTLGVVSLVVVGRTLMGIDGINVSSGSQPSSAQTSASYGQTAGQNSLPSSTSTSGFYDVATPHTAPIPSQALRLRIIANSDSQADQDTKLAVRDAIVVQVAKIVSGSKDETEAQQRVLASLPQLRETALNVAHERGYHYSVNAVVGKEPFPTKLYGNQVYPAGDYNALIITLGSGQGQNWWCVLFPPLCFVDIADGDAVPNTAGFPDLPPLETLSIPNSLGQPEQVQVRLAVLDYGEVAWKALKRWLP